MASSLIQPANQAYLPSNSMSGSVSGDAILEQNILAKLALAAQSDNKDEVTRLTEDALAIIRSNPHTVALLTSKIRTAPVPPSSCGREAVVPSTSFSSATSSQGDLMQSDSYLNSSQESHSLSRSGSGLSSLTSSTANLSIQNQGQSETHVSATSNPYESRASTHAVFKGRKEKESGGSRKDNSLNLLTRKFLTIIHEADGSNVDLNKAAVDLSVQKRRLYDITNVLEGIGLVEKKSKNQIRWRGLNSPIASATSKPVATGPVRSKPELLADLTAFEMEERKLDEQILFLTAALKDIEESEESSKYCFVTYDDIRNHPSMANETIMAVKAPVGTRLEVPDPDEGNGVGRRRFQIFLKSEADGHQPIDVYLVSRIDDVPSVEQVAEATTDSMAVDGEQPYPARQAILGSGVDAPDGDVYDYYLAMLNSEPLSEFYTD